MQRVVVLTRLLQLRELQHALAVNSKNVVGLKLACLVDRTLVVVDRGGQLEGQGVSQCV